MYTTGTRVRELRLKHKLTQRELGRSVGVTQGAIGHIETGRVTPPIKTLRRLAEYFDVPLAVLIVEDDSAVEPTPQAA